MAKGVKTGGRKVGTPNRTTAEIREHFQNLIADNLDQLKNDLKELEPIQRLKMIIELSRFVLPTLKAIESKSQNDNNIKPVQVVMLTPEQKKIFEQIQLENEQRCNNK